LKSWFNHGSTFSKFSFCCVTGWYNGFRTYCLHLQVNPEQGSSMFLHSGTNLSDHILMPQPRRSQYYQCCHANCKLRMVILSSLWFRGVVTACWANCIAWTSYVKEFYLTTDACCTMIT
jgi:hypothetical protein